MRGGGREGREGREGDERIEGRVNETGRREGGLENRSESK